MYHAEGTMTYESVLVAKIKEPFAPPRQGIDHRHRFLITIGEEDVPAAAVLDVPAVVDAVALLEGGEEEVAATNGGGLVPVGAAGGDDGGERGERRFLNGARGVEEEAQ